MQSRASRPTLSCSQEAHPFKTGAVNGERRIRDLLQEVDDVIWSADLGEGDSLSTATLRYVNGAVESIYGEPKDAFFDSPTLWMKRAHPADQDRVSTLPKRLFENGEASEEYRIIRLDGEVRWVESRVFLVYDDAGTPIQMGGITSDVTNRKEAKDRMRRQKQRYRDFMDRCPIGIYRMTPGGKILYANDAFLGLLGFDSFEGVKKMNVEESPIAEEDRETFRRALEANGSLKQRETQMTRTDGTTITVLESARIVEEGDSVVYEGVIEDVTERKRQREELRDAKKKAEEGERLKSAVLANMSHEIRTPLTSIIGFAELLAENLDGELANFADRIHTSSQRLQQTFTSMLQLSRLEAGVLDLEREAVSIDQLIHETVRMLRPKATEKNVHIETSVPGEPITGLWNEGALHRIVTNLLENAIKYTPEGGKIFVRAQRTGEGEAVVEVEDTGIGIDPSFLPHIFEPFQQESSGTARAYEGSGLGLSLVKRFIEGLGGTVHVETEKGDGTCFRVRLPDQEPE